MVTFFLVLLSLFPDSHGEAPVPPERDAMTVKTPKHIITLAPTGLPAQIVIQHAPSEIPLVIRTKGTELTEAHQRSMGRGPQMRDPARLVARIAGQGIAAEAVKPAETRKQENLWIVQSELKAGTLALRLETIYHPTGRWDAAVTYGDAGAELESLTFVLDLAGTIDTIVPGPPVDEKLRVYRPAEFTVGTEEGLAWVNTGPDIREGARNVPGLVNRLFLGTGDRGFTWLAEKAEGFLLDAALPSARLLRDKTGLLTWMMDLVNHPVRLDGPQTARFSLLTHPAGAKPALARAKLWTEELKDLPRTDKVLDRMENASVVALQGPAGGDSLSAEQHLATIYPISLFRYLAATHTGMAAQLVPNSARFIRPGECPAADRMALGRALLHDIGLDASGIAHLSEAATVLKALEEFGCLKEDDQTEFIPYWRNQEVIRYGEIFSQEDAFGLNQEDPVRDVHVSVWCRPTGKAFKALIIVVNESPNPVRQQLYILDSSRVFGGPNAVLAENIIDTWDMSAIPGDSDWSRGRLKGQAVWWGGVGSNVTLLDLADRGFVRQTTVKGNMEVYGPLYLAPYSFRILYGAGKGG